MKKLVSILLTAALMQGCSTPYQKNGHWGGFSETHLAENTFQVSFEGNDATSFEKISDFSLMRSAELTLNNGFKYFVMSHVNVSTKHDTLGTEYTNVTRLIECFEQEPKNISFNGKNLRVFDAKFVLNSISKKYNFT